MIRGYGMLDLDTLLLRLEEDVENGDGIWDAIYRPC